MSTLKSIAWLRARRVIQTWWVCESLLHRTGWPFDIWHFDASSSFSGSWRGSRWTEVLEKMLTGTHLLSFLRFRSLAFSLLARFFLPSALTETLVRVSMCTLHDNLTECYLRHVICAAVSFSETCFSRWLEDFCKIKRVWKPKALCVYHDSHRLQHRGRPRASQRILPFQSIRRYRLTRSSVKG